MHMRANPNSIETTFCFIVSLPAYFHSVFRDYGPKHFIYFPRVPSSLVGAVVSGHFAADALALAGAVVSGHFAADAPALAGAAVSGHFAADAPCYLLDV